MIDFKGLWGDFLNPKITRKRFDELIEVTPKRICFGSTHRNALKKADGGPAGYFNVPFSETIGEVFPWQIFKNKFGYSRTIKSEGEFDEIAAWIETNREIVFIRSHLDSCIALCEHLDDHGRSEIGQLEYRAKWRDDSDAVGQLTDILAAVARRLDIPNEINSICAIPSSKPRKRSLPSKLAAGLAAELSLEDITSLLRWNREKDTIKDKEASEKWSILEDVGLTVDGELKGRNILIIDDMYQSGATVHFVASKLQEAGASQLHCLAVSKSRGDKDNI